MNQNRPHSRIRHHPKRRPFGDLPFRKVSLLSRDSHARSYIVRVGTAAKSAESHPPPLQPPHQCVLKIHPIPRRSDSATVHKRSFAEFQLQDTLSSSNSRCVSSVRDFASNPRANFIVKDLPKSGFLSKYFQTLGPFSEPEARFICRQLLYVFCILHESRVTFNDWRFSSFGVTEGFRIKLFDFSRALELKWDENRRKYRGPGYIAPEMLAREKNLYAYFEDTICVGRILYALMSGTELQLEEDGTGLDIPNEIVDECPASEECRRLLKHCLFARPADRENVWELNEGGWFRKHQMDEICFNENGPRLKIPERLRRLMNSDESDSDEEWLQLSYRGPWRQREQNPYSSRFVFRMRECSFATQRRKMATKKTNQSSNRIRFPPMGPTQGMWVDVSLDSPKHGLGFRLNTGIVGAHFNDFSSILYNPTRQLVRLFNNGDIEEYDLTRTRFQRFHEEARSVVKKIKLVRWFEKRFQRSWGRRDAAPDCVMDSSCLVWPPIPDFFK